MSVDYTIFYKDSYVPVSGWANAFSWDVFISAYNTTERVRRVFDDVRAGLKLWIVHSEYAFGASELPAADSGKVFAPSGLRREDDFVQEFVGLLGDLGGARICLDISGFMRPHLLFLVRLLAAKGIRSFDALYSEPGQYVRREHTEFAQGNVVEVRPIAGFEGAHQPTIANDDSLLIIGAGYEHLLMRDVANSKTNTRKLQLLGFPPLQADFYQENVLKGLAIYRSSRETDGTLAGTSPQFASL